MYRWVTHTVIERIWFLILAVCRVSASGLIPSYSPVITLRPSSGSTSVCSPPCTGQDRVHAQNRSSQTPPPTPHAKTTLTLQHKKPVNMTPHSVENSMQNQFCHGSGHLKWMFSPHFAWSRWSIPTGLDFPTHKHILSHLKSMDQSRNLQHFTFDGV